MRNYISLKQKMTAAAFIFTLFAPAFAIRANVVKNGKPLTEEQRLLHVLNRLGFGARPGDVEKVKKVGVQRYIEIQLNAPEIDDAAAEGKVNSLEVFKLSTAELFAKYPNPGALLRQLEGRHRNNQPNAQDKAKMPANGAAPQDPNATTQAERRERREKMRELYEKYDLKPAAQILPQVTANRVLRAVYSERQLQEVMVDFWQNHFNVFAGKGALRWYIPSYERDVLRKNALGNFKDLLVGTASHPAMLFYLDNFESVSPNAQTRGNGDNIQRLLRNGGQISPQTRDRIRQRTGATDTQMNQRIEQARLDPRPAQPRRQRGINENYARELMELHTLGVDDGYTQKDIIEVAKCFTGWTIADPRGYRRAAASMINGDEDRRSERVQRSQGIPEGVESGEFYFNSRWHEDGAKTFLGQKIDEGGVKDGLKVLDILVNNPQTARFIARKLAVKFVSDNPSDGLISRVADAFHKSKGDIKATLKALFNDKEFFATENYRAKVKSPFELAVSSIRALGGDTTASPAFAAMLNKLGEVPYGYQAPTGYPDTAEDWVNTGALLERLNFAVAIASNRIPGTRVNLKGFEAKEKSQMLDKAVARLLDGEISPSTRSLLLKQIEQPLPEVKAGSDLGDANMEIPNMRGGQEGGLRKRQARLLEPSGNPEVFRIISLVLGTPEFQRQ